MRFHTSGDLRRVDLAPVLALVAPLHRAWSELTFASDGNLLHPGDGRVVDACRLVAGTHREPGARYTVLVETPIREVPSDLKAGFDSEAIELQGRKASPDAWKELGRRKAAVSGAD